MIITRSPLRISLGGGGTDLASYYAKEEGFLIAGAIDKYVYITVHQAFVQEFILKYSKLEKVKSVDEMEHPIIREAFKLINLKGPYLEISSMADIPARTGMGSSGSFTTALLKGLHLFNKKSVNPLELAEQACKIEIDILKEPIGKQDQYVAAHGGVACYTFKRDGGVVVEPLQISKETLYNLEDNLLLFFTGYSRNASMVLKEQDDRSKRNDKDMINNLNQIKQLAIETKQAFEKNNLRKFAEIMNTHWQNKRKRSASMSNPQIDEWYDFGIKNGALGGKLIGAGGGGFLLFYSEEKRKLREAMNKIGLIEVRFHFDFEGTKSVA